MQPTDPSGRPSGSTSTTYATVAVALFDRNWSPSPSSYAGILHRCASLV
jgi:hypothetical protein